MKKLSLLAAIGIAAALSANAQVYSTGVITDNSFLSLVGPVSSVVYGLNIGGTAQVTANGYAFGAGGTSYAGGAGAIPSPVFMPNATTGDPGLDAILGAGQVPGPDPSTLTLNGLIVGETYNLLVFNADTRDGINQDRAFRITHNGLQSSSQVYAFFQGVGGFGGYILDTFVATAASENVSINQPNGAQLNGVLLAQVPEPSVFTLAILGLASLVIRRVSARRA